jgi:hypothetical protein
MRHAHVLIIGGKLFYSSFAIWLTHTGRPTLRYHISACVRTSSLNIGDQGGSQQKMDLQWRCAHIHGVKAFLFVQDSFWLMPYIAVVLGLSGNFVLMERRTGDSKVYIRVLQGSAPTPHIPPGECLMPIYSIVMFD